MAELIWEGKYLDPDRRVKASPVRIALPFQTVETVNESAQERQKSLEALWAGKRETEWRNRLIWGDKKYVLPSLLDEFAGKVDLIYIDPPFNTGANFAYMAEVPDDPGTDGDQRAEFIKRASVIEQKAYRDTWGQNHESYVAWFFDLAVLARELLSEAGSIYVHLDYNVSHYAKCILDEVFGLEMFRNEIAWQRTNAHNMKMRYYPRYHDVIFFYTKSDRYTWNTPLTGHSEAQLKRYKEDLDGRLYTGQDLTVSSKSATRKETWRGSTPPPGRSWAASLEERERLWAEGMILTKKDGTPRLDGLKVFLDERDGRKVGSVWTDIDRVGNTSAERLPYDTQKPEKLLERIVHASSNQGELVLDCFVGSGTTAAVAEKLGRRWIACDLGRFAIHTTRKRLLQIPDVKPFVVQNLGKYERQAWQVAEFGENAGEKTLRYRKFILELYKADSITGYEWFHGSKASRFVHVGTVDSPVSVGDVTAICAEFKRAIGTGENAPKTNGVDVLGWDFAFDINEVAKKQAADAGVNIAFKKIPREVLEKKAVEQGDIVFYELAALDVEVRTEERRVQVALSNFVISPDDVPEEVQSKITHWSQWVDYWAIDWDNKGDTFHNMWQSYRTRKNKKLDLATEHDYSEPGEYILLIKVIDLLGNDTTKAVRVTVK